MNRNITFLTSTRLVYTCTCICVHSDVHPNYHVRYYFSTSQTVNLTAQHENRRVIKSVTANYGYRFHSFLLIPFFYSFVNHHQYLLFNSSIISYVFNILLAYTVYSIHHHTDSIGHGIPLTQDPSRSLEGTVVINQIARIDPLDYSNSAISDASS